jgi:hypothetical protein
MGLFHVERTSEPGFSPSEIVMGCLTPDELLQQVPQIATVAERWGETSLLCMYGWGCNAPADQLWQKLEVNVSDLVTFVATSIERGVFAPAAADLHISDKSETFEFLLCHESDIHFKSIDPRFLNHIAGLWTSLGKPLHCKTEAGEWKDCESPA